jgi:PAS domain-containing protein
MRARALTAAASVSAASKAAILQPLSVLRPKFRAIAQALSDMDHVFVEEAFERLLLDYDRVFSAMGIPACLWRRTGEIYKGNREFADLLGIDIHLLREVRSFPRARASTRLTRAQGRLCIYELMAEESAVNYWEKYGHVAFDSAQKAVLTSCVLRLRPAGDAQDGFVSCAFSITIRRDAWGIPSMIVGNFIRLC